MHAGLIPSSLVGSRRHTVSARRRTPGSGFVSSSLAEEASYTQDGAARRRKTRDRGLQNKTEERVALIPVFNYYSSVAASMDLKKKKRHTHLKLSVSKAELPTV